MEIDERQALRDLFLATQDLLAEAQSWYTMSSGNPGVPEAIQQVRRALIAPALARAIRPGPPK